jgi:hypothetical protein
MQEGKDYHRCVALLRLRAVLQPLLMPIALQTKSKIQVCVGVGFLPSSLRFVCFLEAGFAPYPLQLTE